MFNARIGQTRLALMLLTRLPAGTLPAPVPDVSASLWAFPLVGLLVGSAGLAVGFGATWAGLAPLMAALLAVATQILLTGALHEDGLADTADGLGGGRDREHALSIMRDSRLGSYGVIALILAICVRIVGTATLIDARDWFAFVALAALSRSAMAATLAILPTARSDGMGHDAAAGDAAPNAAAALAIASLFLIPLGLVPALATITGIILASCLIGWRAYGKLGGQTGDVLGATQQTAEIAGIVVLCALADWY